MTEVSVGQLNIMIVDYENHSHYYDEDDKIDAFYYDFDDHVDD